MGRYDYPICRKYYDSKYYDYVVIFGGLMRDLKLVLSTPTSFYVFCITDFFKKRNDPVVGYIHLNDIVGKSNSPLLKASTDRLAGVPDDLVAHLRDVLIKENEENPHFIPDEKVATMIWTDTYKMMVRIKRIQRAWRAWRDRLNRPERVLLAARAEPDLDAGG